MTRHTVFAAYWDERGIILGDLLMKLSLWTHVQVITRRSLNRVEWIDCKGRTKETSQ